MTIWLIPFLASLILVVCATLLGPPSVMRSLGAPKLLRIPLSMKRRMLLPVFYTVDCAKVYYVTYSTAVIVKIDPKTGVTGKALAELTALVSARNPDYVLVKYEPEDSP